MCGITGFLLERNNNINLESLVLNMTKTLKHRGPDNIDNWHNKEKGVALGHTRLSILDLSANGSQPMLDSTQRYVIIYNGEIYNHNYLRNYLHKNYSANIKWNSTSDTETLIQCIYYMGIEKSLKLIDGMFAFALFDNKKNTLTLVRDRFGQKPLYYGWVNNNFVFASELKAIKSFSGFNNELNLNSLSLYFKFMYIPAPHTIYKDIYKLRPGHMLNISLQEKYLKIDKTNNFQSKNFIYKSWWSLEQQIKLSKNKSYSNNIEMRDELSLALSNSVKDQLISDVPIGCFLSGGIDSSTITSIMSDVSSSKISTFSVGINNLNYDESKYAKIISNYLNTDHNEIFLSEKDLTDSIHDIPEIYDEPFADSSQIPTFLISKFAREKIKVVLTGDAGDELFGGYNRYVWATKSWNIIKYLPFSIRRSISKFLLKLPSNFNQILINIVIRFFKFDIDKSSSLIKLNKFLQKLETIENLDDMYFSLIVEWKNYEKILSSEVTTNEFSEFLEPDISLSYQEKMMFWDSQTYLPDDILCKVDRASMSVGLESRLPFLGNEVVDVAWSVPLNRKINNENTKIILREVLAQYLPDNLYNRSKMGFSIPIGDWFKNQLKELVYDNLSKSNLQKHNILNFKTIENTINDHMLNNYNNQHKLWSLLMFQLWLNNN